MTVSATQVRSSGDQLAKLARLLDSGEVRVAVDSTYPLSEAAVAHERAEAGHIQGKIVLAVGDAIADQSGQAGVPSVQWPPRMRGH